MHVYRDTQRHNSIPLERYAAMTTELTETLSRYAISIASPICCPCNTLSLSWQPVIVDQNPLWVAKRSFRFVLLHRLGRRAKEGTIQCFLAPYGINCT